jgi:hypothetical protein
LEIRFSIFVNVFRLENGGFRALQVLTVLKDRSYLWVDSNFIADRDVMCDVSGVAEAVSTIEILVHPEEASQGESAGTAVSAFKSAQRHLLFAHS